MSIFYISEAHEYKSILYIHMYITINQTIKEVYKKCPKPDDKMWK